MSDEICSVCGFEAIHYLVLEDGSVICDDCIGDGDALIRSPSHRKGKQLKKLRDRQCELDF